MTDLEKRGTTTQIARAEAVKSQLTGEAFVNQLAQVLPTGIAGRDPAREAKRLALVFWGACRNTPRLLECDISSVLSGFMHSGEMGLIPNTPAGEAYLVPYWDRARRCYAAQWQPGYRGLVKRGYELGLVKDEDVRLVYKNERFEYRAGRNWDIAHTPILDEDERGEMICGYAICRLMTGGTVHEVKSRQDLDAVKDRSKSRDKSGKLVGPWVTDTEAMYLKTLLNALYHRHIPMSSSLSKLVGVSTAIEAGLRDPDPYIEGEIYDQKALETTARTLNNADKIQKAIEGKKK